MKGLQSVLQISLVLFIFVGGCSRQPTSEEQTIKRAELAVKKTLKDPDSAEFSDERANDMIVCGNVNAKNSFGGFVGYHRFFVMSDIPMIESDNPDLAKIFAIQWKLCPQANSN